MVIGARGLLGRNFHQVEGCVVSVVCDSNIVAQKRAARDFPGVQVTSDPCEVMSSPHIDAVAIVTPVCTHFDLARTALENGKHVFVEKPFTATALQAEQLIELADRKSLQIMVDHTFLFTGAVRKMRQLIEEENSESFTITIRPVSTSAFSSTT